LVNTTRPFKNKYHVYHTAVTRARWPFPDFCATLFD